MLPAARGHVLVLVVAAIAACDGLVVAPARPSPSAQQRVKVRRRRPIVIPAPNVEEPSPLAQLENAAAATIPGLAEDDVIELPPLGDPSHEPGFRHKNKPPSDFELNLGRCIDALKSDFPEFFDRELQWDVYTEDIEIRDPSGVQLKGLAMYRQSLSMVRLFRRVMIDDVSVTFRLRYDWVRRRIIVQWYSAWVGSMSTGHVDAVSIFHLNDDGLIYRHEIDKVMVNDEPVSPPYGLGWLSFRAHVLSGLDRRPVPAGACPGGAFCASERLDDDAPPAENAPPSAVADADPYSDVSLASSSLALSSSSSRRRRDDAKDAKGILDNLPQTCENVWDCESPLFCCDFAFIKVCCSQGSPAFAPQPIPIPVPVEPFPQRRQYPPGGY